MNKCDLLQDAINTLPDQLGSGYYFNNGLYCGVGWLGHCMGISDEKLMVGTTELLNVIETIGEYYGLNNDDIHSLISINDLYPVVLGIEEEKERIDFVFKSRKDRVVSALNEIMERVCEEEETNEAG